MSNPFQVWNQNNRIVEPRTIDSMVATQIGIVFEDGEVIAGPPLSTGQVSTHWTVRLGVIQAVVIANDQWDQIARVELPEPCIVGPNWRSLSVKIWHSETWQVEVRLGPPTMRPHQLVETFPDHHLLSIPFGTIIDISGRGWHEGPLLALNDKRASGLLSQPWMFEEPVRVKQVTLINQHKVPLMTKEVEWPIWPGKTFQMLFSSNERGQWEVRQYGL